MFADGPLAAYSFDVSKQVAKYATEQEDHYKWYINNHIIKRKQSFNDGFYGYLIHEYLKELKVKHVRITYTHPVKNGNISRFITKTL